MKHRNFYRTMTLIYVSHTHTIEHTILNFEDSKLNDSTATALLSMLRIGKNSA